MVPYKLKFFVKKVLFKFSRIINDYSEFNSFPFNPELPLSEYKHDTFVECINLLKDNEMYFRVTDGTILGIYRDRSLIAHDNDIDVDAIIKDDQVIKKLINSFSHKNYKIGRIVYRHDKIQQIVFYNLNEDIFDILFWWEDNNVLYNFSEKGYVRTQDTYYFNNLSQVEFLGLQIPAPFDLDKWLELRYGEDWKTPKTFKGDWKLDCFDLKKL